MRRALLLFLLLGLPASVRAEWAYVSVEELVQESDVIVVGTLRDVTEYTADNTDYGQGRIEVREVIWGAVSPGDSLTLKWQNASAIACPRVEHRHNADEEGIWLLTRDGDAVNANYPGRFVELSERTKVEAALARSPVVLRGGNYWVKRGSPMGFVVVYRNVSDAARSFPAVAYETGRLRLAPGSRLTVKVSPGSGGEKPASLEGRVVTEPGLAPVTVAPRSEYSVGIFLHELLRDAPKDGESFEVSLRLAGHPPTNEVSFYIGEPASLRPAPPPPAIEPITSVTVKLVPVARHGLAPLTRAGLTALVALLLFPIFYRLRAALSAARLARVIHGAQTWQI